MAGEAVQAMAVYNMRAYGASGVKTDNAQPAIQTAIDACAAMC